MCKLKLSLVCLSFALLPALYPLQAAQPQIVLTDTGSEGASSLFYLRVNDADGVADLASLNLLINSTFDGASGCWLYYDIPGNQLNINGDGGWGTASSRCSASITQIAASPGYADISVKVHFSPAWAGEKKIWARASDVSANDSGYNQIGTYTVLPTSAPDFVAAALTSSITVIAGGSANLSFQLTALNGYQGTISITTQFSGPGASSIGAYGAKSETLPITAIDPPRPSIVVPYGLSTSASTPPGAVIATVTLSDGVITHTLPLTLIVKSPTEPSVSVTRPSESSPDFTVTATDPAGFQALSSVNFLMNTSLDGSNACWLAWLPAANAADGSGTLALANDDASAWSQIAVGPLPNLAPLGNGQCSFPAGSVKSTGSGEALALQFAPQFSALFIGNKSIYVSAAGQDGTTTGYISAGAWNASADSSGQIDFQIAVTPGSQNIAAGSNAFFSATISPFVGFSGTVNFNVTGLPAGASVTALQPVAPGAESRFAVTTSVSTPPGSYPITITGTSGALTHSTQVQLNVYKGLPSAWISPAGGIAMPPSPYAWMYLSTDPAGYQNVSSLNILFNDRVDGQHACWIYFDGVVPWLASDDGAVWTRIPGGPGAAENSQCAVNFGGIVPGAYFGAILTVSFKPGFAPANLYEDAVNRQGGDSGYQLQNGMSYIKPWAE